MRKVFLAALLIGCSTFTAQAQRISRVSAGLDVGTGFGKGHFSPSLLYYQTIQPANAPWLRLTGGGRVWNYQAQDTYLTAPGGSSMDDTMQLSRASATGFSFVMGMSLRLGNFVDIGANADLLSFAFGKRRTATYRIADPSSIAESDTISPKLNGEGVDIAPANLNAVPAFLRNNNGQAEAFVRIWLGKQVGVKFGYMIGQISYRSDFKLNNGQKRFSSGYQMPYVALSFPLYN
ncbi:hypothetical protein [Persicitalea sp.]|uniref:hypothetical protein n=1 Tax=Persicitalea sp. TaxID=3100273 RepID=UPI0035940004